MIQKIKNLESYYVLQKNYLWGTGYSNYYLSLGNYIETMSKLIDLINHFNSKNDNGIINWLMIIFYKFLCNCFITYNQHIKDSKGIFVKEGLPTLFIRKENKYSKQQIESLLKKELLINYTENETYIDIKTNLALFLKFTITDHELNIEIKENPRFSYDIDNKINISYNKT